MASKKSETKKAALSPKEKARKKQKMMKFLKRAGVVAAVVVVMGVIGAASLFAGNIQPKKDKYVGKILSITALEEKQETVAQIKRLTYNDMLIINSVQNNNYTPGGEVEQAALDGAEKDNLSYDDVADADGKGVDIDKVKARTRKYKLNEIQESVKLSAAATMTTTNMGGTGDAIYIDSSQLAGKKYLGKFVVTAYCPCSICCGEFANGITASGKTARANHTIATDTMFAFGTQLIIGNQVYTVEDRGGAIKGNRIDVYFNTHQEALNWGRRTMDVYAY